MQTRARTESVVEAKANELTNEGGGRGRRTDGRREQGRKEGIFKMKLSCLGQNRFYDSAPSSPSLAVMQREAERAGGRADGRTATAYALMATSPSDGRKEGRSCEE